MQTFIRRLHLFTGLVLAVWVVMYFVTGYVMIHETWFQRGQPKKTTTTEPLDYAGNAGTDEFMRHLETAFGIRGRRQPPHQQQDRSWRFAWTRPGINHEAIVAATGDKVTITRSEFGPTGLAHGLHRLHGYGGGGLYDVWALFYDLASGSMILFALTGIGMWWTTAKKRWPGFLCLAASFGFSGAMIAYWMFSR